MVEQNRNDVRTDMVMATQVEAGLALSVHHGIHPALQFMAQAGVPRAVALRVLCSPRYYRRRDRRSVVRPVR
jgi:hypothetical protein